MAKILDEDWYRNPRCSEVLRALAAEPEPELTEPTLRAAAVELACTLSETAS